MRLSLISGFSYSSALFVAIAALLVAPAVSTPVRAADAGASFDESVAQKVLARTGGKGQLHWLRRPEDQEQVARSIRSMLTRRKGLLTLDAAVQIALLNNRILQARFEEVGISYAEYVQAGLLSNPDFSGSIRLPDRPPSGADVETAIAGDVLDWLLTPLRHRLAGRQLALTELRVADDALKLTAEVKRAVYTLQGRQQLLGALREIVATNEAAAGFSKQLHDAGNINDLDLANQEATYSQSRLDVAQTEAQIASDHERLNRLLGLWGENTAWRVTDRLPSLPKEEVSLEHLEVVAVTRRLDLEAARLGLVATGQALALTGSTRFFPTGIKIGVDSERSPDKQRITGPTLGLEIPIFDQGQARVSKLQAQYRLAQRQLEAEAIDIRSEVREARDQVVANRDLAKYAGEILLPQRRHIVELSQQQYNAMLRGAPDLFLAKQNQINAERSAAESLRDYWIARADLERALGGEFTPGTGGKEVVRKKAVARKK